MSPKRAKKTVLRLHADPNKIRRVWAIKPKTRVHVSSRKERLLKLRQKEASEDQ